VSSNHKITSHTINLIQACLSEAARRVESDASGGKMPLRGTALQGHLRLEIWDCIARATTDLNAGNYRQKMKSCAIGEGSSKKKDCVHIFIYSQ